MGTAGPDAEQTYTVQSDVEPRLDRLPWSRWHAKVVFALGFAWLLDSLEASIIGSVLAILKKTWHFTPLQGSLTVSVWLAGIMGGAVLFGYLSDRYGRKKIFIFTLLWYSAFTVACAFSTGIWSFILLRFMAALGIGGEYAAISSAVVEFIPKKVRGRTDALIMSMWPVGAICSALLVILALKVFEPEIAWRAGFLLAVLLALFALYVRRYLPESPRWLTDHNRMKDAAAIVDAVEEEIISTKGLGKLPSVRPISVTPGHRSVRKITKELYWRYPGRVTLGSLLNFSQVALGYGSLALASLVLFPVTGTPPEEVPLLMMIAFLFAFLGGLTSVCMLDSVGRKFTAFVSFGLMPLSAFSIVLVTSTVTALVSLCVMQYCYTWGWVTEYVIKSEIFPTRIRAAGIGWSTFFGRTGGIVSAPIITAVYQSTRSLRAAACALALLTLPGFIAAVVWAVRGVEGKHKALEELS